MKGYVLVTCLINNEETTYTREDYIKNKKKGLISLFLLRTGGNGGKVVKFFG